MPVSRNSRLSRLATDPFNLRSSSQSGDISFRLSCSQSAPKIHNFWVQLFAPSYSIRRNTRPVLAQIRASIRPDSSRSALLVSLYACHVPGWYITSRLSDADVCPTVGGERPASLIYPSPRLLQGKTGRHPGSSDTQENPKDDDGSRKEKRKHSSSTSIFLETLFWKLFFSSSSPPPPPPLPPSCLQRCSWRKRGCILFRTFSSRQLYRSSVGRNYKKKMIPMSERSSNPP